MLRHVNVPPRLHPQHQVALVGLFVQRSILRVYLRAPGGHRPYRSLLPVRLRGLPADHRLPLAGRHAAWFHLLVGAVVKLPWISQLLFFEHPRVIVVHDLGLPKLESRGTMHAFRRGNAVLRRHVELHLVWGLEVHPPGDLGEIRHFHHVWRRGRLHVIPAALGAGAPELGVVPRVSARFSEPGRVDDLPHDSARGQLMPTTVDTLGPFQPGNLVSRLPCDNKTVIVPCGQSGIHHG
mmetsp:Transcript_6415/g.15675  ORF Transcript_6415/g.15675 Transcript_6415/m.15675 type:complete len:237 (-) Transcript_6415:448-1158(-)